MRNFFRTYYIAFIFCNKLRKCCRRQQRQLSDFKLFFMHAQSDLYSESLIKMDQSIAQLEVEIFAKWQRMYQIFSFLAYFLNIPLQKKMSKKLVSCQKSKTLFFNFFFRLVTLLYKELQRRVTSKQSRHFSKMESAQTTKTKW